MKLFQFDKIGQTEEPNFIKFNLLMLFVGPLKMNISKNFALGKT